MQQKSLLAKLVQASTLSLLGSATNLFSTILVARAFGATIYTNYIYDLALLALFLILLEAIPSNYSTFKVQEEPEWVPAIALQMAISIMLLPGIIWIAGNITSLFRDFSLWMAIYVALMPVKRYFDIIYQSTGRVSTLFKAEAVNAVARLLILLFIIHSGRFLTNDGLWMSLALGAFISQAFAILTVPRDSNSNSTPRAKFKAPLQLLISARSQYTKYYLGIGLKRLRDNLLTILAPTYLTNHDSLAAFYLAYRGLQFSAGQLRIIESFLNHRATLAVLLSDSKTTTLIVASAIGQLLSVIAASIIVYTGTPSQSTSGLAIAIALSFSIWPIAFTMFERARALSQYNVGNVNASIAGYIGTLAIGVAVLETTSDASPMNLALVTTSAELVTAAVLFIRRKKNAP